MTGAIKETKFKWVIVIITAINMFFCLSLLGQGERKLTGDQLQYNQLAVNLAEHLSFSLASEQPIEPTLYRTPGYPIFVAFFYLVSGKSVLLVKIIQFILLGLTAYFLYLLARYYTNNKTAQVSALFLLIYFPFLFVSSMILSETLTTFLIVILAYLLKRNESGENRRIDLLMGLILGYLTLIRPSMALTVILITLTLWTPFFLKRKNISLSKLCFRTLLMFVGLGVIVTPWTIRNTLIAQKFVPLTIMTGSESLYFSLLQYQGVISYKFTNQEWHSVYFPDFFSRVHQADELINKMDVDAKIATLPKSVQREILMEESFGQSIQEERPKLNFLTVIKSFPIRLAYLWSTADYAPLDKYNGLLHRIGQVQYLLFFLLALLGVAIQSKDIINHWILWLFPVYLTVVHSFFLVEGRYTIPARPFLLIYCSLGVVWLWNKALSIRGNNYNKYLVEQV